MDQPDRALPSIDYRTEPERYRHWRLLFDGQIATLLMDVQEDGGIRTGYTLKLNSYDLGVDLELHDAIQRIRFEHPEVRAVVIGTAKTRVFCSGANIYMLGSSSHAWKVNFCKFTNETRNSIEDASRFSGLKFIAACKGAAAGGGYELALACDEIVLVDDRSSAVSLPEVPLLGVLPGTGGLTRVTDKRRVRRDLADVFCTSPDGAKGARAKDWGLVDAVVKPDGFDAYVAHRARACAAGSDRPPGERGIVLSRLARTDDEAGYHYEYVDVRIDARKGVATLTVSAPEQSVADTPADIVAAGARWWPLEMARELDDAILMLRTNHTSVGLWIVTTRGNPSAVLASDAALLAHREHWFVREVLGMLRRTFARLEVSSRSIYAIVEPDSCFAGSLLELALAADRVYMLADSAARLTLSEISFGSLPAVNGLTRLESRFHQDATAVAALHARLGTPLDAREAERLGLVTSAPDDIDWDDELRIAIEARLALSPDALTGLEANLRFGPHETMASRIFGRLSAWQNWIFMRPNAVGPSGALKVYGSGQRVQFDQERV
jgi:benzoyl-CoA-dihydrodiol lyase